MPNLPREQLVPMYPGRQVQAPLAGSQVALFKHAHVLKQSGP